MKTSKQGAEGIVHSKSMKNIINYPETGYDPKSGYNIEKIAPSRRELFNIRRQTGTGRALLLDPKTKYTLAQIDEMKFLIA